MACICLKFTLFLISFWYSSSGVVLLLVVSFSSSSSRRGSAIPKPIPGIKSQEVEQEDDAGSTGEELSPHNTEFNNNKGFVVVVEVVVAQAEVVVVVVVTEEVVEVVALVVTIHLMGSGSVGDLLPCV